jgi:hypothetical protein
MDKVEKHNRTTINAEWHRNNRMPENATDQQRITWHLAHARECGCRPIPDSIKQLISENST